jgi:Resolvase, N terminal domain
MAEELQPEARRQILSLLLAGRLYIDELRSERGVGLGLEAQQAAVRGYLGQSVPIAEFTEIETDNRNDRPELERALALCRKRKARLVIAKLDRLSGVEFVAVDNPHATRLTASAPSASGRSSTTTGWPFDDDRLAEQGDWACPR